MATQRPPAPTRLSFEARLLLSTCHCREPVPRATDSASLSARPVGLRGDVTPSEAGRPGRASHGLCSSQASGKALSSAQPAVPPGPKGRLWSFFVKIIINVKSANNKMHPFSCSPRAPTHGNTPLTPALFLQLSKHTSGPGFSVKPTALTWRRVAVPQVQLPCLETPSAVMTGGCHRGSGPGKGPGLLMGFLQCPGQPHRAPPSPSARSGGCGPLS